MLDTNADRIKLIVEIIEIAEKASKYLPIVVFSYAGLTLVFAVINILEHNIVSGMIPLHIRGVWHISCIKTYAQTFTF